jgi:hypothetical protein
MEYSIQPDALDGNRNGLFVEIAIQVRNVGAMHPGGYMW